MSRFFVLLTMILVVVFPLTSFALSRNEEALLSYINARLEKWQSLQGSFVQRNPDGRIVKGRFAIKRPNRFRMDYAPPSQMKVISDGVTIMVQQKEDAPVLRYPISVTPIPSIFSLTRTRLEEVATVISVERREKRMIVMMREEEHIGVEIKLVFQDKDVFTFIGWVAKDFSGETLVLLKDVEYNVSIPGSFFTLLTYKR